MTSHQESNGIYKVRESLKLEQQIKRIEKTESKLESIRINKVLQLALLRSKTTK